VSGIVIFRRIFTVLSQKKLSVCSDLPLLFTGTMSGGSSKHVTVKRARYASVNIRNEKNSERGYECDPAHGALVFCSEGDLLCLSIKFLSLTALKLLSASSALQMSLA
jgi:hypothetical protein